MFQSTVSIFPADSQVEGNISRDRFYRYRSFKIKMPLSPVMISSIHLSEEQSNISVRIITLSRWFSPSVIQNSDRIFELFHHEISGNNLWRAKYTFCFVKIRAAISMEIRFKLSLRVRRETFLRG